MALRCDDHHLPEPQSLGKFGGPQGFGLSGHGPTEIRGVSAVRFRSFGTHIAGAGAKENLY